MKQYFIQPAFFVTGFLLMAAVLTSCEKGDSTRDFGLTAIYMPQSLQSGHTSLNYLVPSGLDANTYNYIIDSANNRLAVILGVSRSGKQAPEAYSVSVAANPDTIIAAIANGTIQVDPDKNKTVVLLPDKEYSLPQRVTVPAGQYATTFYLSIDINALKGYAGKKVALAVYLSNPTKYPLNTANSETIIIIDVDALNL